MLPFSVSSEYDNTIKTDCTHFVVDPNIDHESIIRSICMEIENWFNKFRRAVIGL